MSKHTPGPWRTQHNEIVATRPNSADLPLCLATVYVPVHYGLQKDREIMLANARLIAAAPDLLKACKQLILAESLPCKTSAEMLAYDSQFSKAFTLMKAAIAKAEGV